VCFELDVGVIKDRYVLEYIWKFVKVGIGMVSWWLVEVENVLKFFDGSYMFFGVVGGFMMVIY